MLFKSLLQISTPIIYMQPSNKIQRTASLQKWRCSICEFDNLGLLTACQICQNPRVKDPKQIQKQRKTQSQLAMVECPNKDCKKLNPLSNETCSRCQKQLFMSDDDDAEDKKDASKIDPVTMVTCKKCNFQNNPDNDLCVNCQRKLVPKRIPRKSVKPKKAVKYKGYLKYMYKPCPKCGEQVKIADFATGELDICQTCEERQPIKITKYLCLFCDKKLTSAQESHHDQACLEQKKFYSRKENETYDRCTDLQYQTMIYMHKKCEKLHYRKQKALIDRIQKLGYSKKDLQNLHHYIMHYAPIIIHMHVNTHFHFFLKDTHYRNQFETRVSSGSLSHSARTGWENRMFDRKHHSATPFERVKYGTMNFTNDPTGVRVCAGYGQSYFLLKPHVRDRCTITDMDSSSPSSTLGTFRFIFHLLMKLSDAELNSAFEGSKGKEMLSSVIGAYKQIQIHGPVEFSKDVERVYISKTQLKLGDAKALLEQVKSFCSKNNIDYQLFDNSIAAPVLFGGVAQVSAPQRIVGDKKQLTEEDLKPPPPPPAPAYFGFGGGGFGASGFGFGGVALGGYSYPASSPASIFSFGGHPFGVAPVVPKPPEKKKEYGVDYI